jgi:hypothetical protein
LALIVQFCDKWVFYTTLKFGPLVGTMQPYQLSLSVLSSSNMRDRGIVDLYNSSLKFTSYGMDILDLLRQKVRTVTGCQVFDERTHADGTPPSTFNVSNLACSFIVDEFISK